MTPYVIEERGPLECAADIGCPVLVDLPGLLCAECGREAWTPEERREAAMENGFEPGMEES